MHINLRYSFNIYLDTIFTKDINKGKGIINLYKQNIDINEHNRVYKNIIEYTINIYGRTSSFLCNLDDLIKYFEKKYLDQIRPELSGDSKKELKEYLTKGFEEIELKMLNKIIEILDLNICTKGTDDYFSQGEQNIFKENIKKIIEYKENDKLSSKIEILNAEPKVPNIANQPKQRNCIII